MPRNQNRRKKLIIDPMAQRRTVRRVTLIPLTVLGLCTATVAITAHEVLKQAAEAEVYLPSLASLLIIMLASLMSAGAAVVIQAVRHSHTIAGPAYRLRKSMERLRSGDWDFRVKLREGDELQDLADEFNGVLEWVQTNSGIGSGLQRQDDASDDLRDSESSEDASSLDPERVAPGTAPRGEVVR